MFEVQGTEFGKPQAALGFGSSHTDSEEQCLEKCECPLCLGTVLSVSLEASAWRVAAFSKRLMHLFQSASGLVSTVCQLITILSGVISATTVYAI